MHELQWDALDFLECLEVIPEVEEEFKTYYLYKVAKNGLVLTVVVRPLESYVWLSLSYEENQNPLFEFALFVRGEVRHIDDKSGNYLKFQDCAVVPSRSSRLKVEGIWEDTFPSWTIELSIKPQISIRYRD